MITCFDTKSENVKKWMDTFGKEFTYKEFLIHNYFLPKYEDYIAVNKEAIHISKIREVLNEIISPELFGVKEISDLKEIGDIKAEGAFYRDTLYFAEQANIYTVYEEGFHAIFQRLVPNENRQEILKAGKALLKTRFRKNLSSYLKDKYVGRGEEYAIEEEIAKEFINYKLYKTSGVLDRNTKVENLAKKLSVLGKSAQSVAEILIDFFEYLSKFFNNVVDNKHKLQALFDMIDSGAFTSSVKLNDIQYDFPSLRPILLEGNRTLNQKTQANIYSGIKSIFKAIRTGNLDEDVELAIKLYKENVVEDEIINSLLEKEYEDEFTEEVELSPSWKTIFEDVKKQIENSTFLLEDEIDEEDGDAISDQINGSSDRDSEKSAIARLSAFSRDYISNIGDLVKVFNYNDKEVYVKSYIEINNVYSAVVRNLANTQDFHTKLRKLVMLSEDRKSKDSRVFVNQFLEDLFLKKNYKGLSAEQYKTQREADFTLLKQKIKLSSGFEFEESGNSNMLYLSPEAVDLFQKVMKSFDLYTAEVVQLLVETNKGDVISYDPHKNNVVLPQLDEWRNNYEIKEWEKIDSVDLKRTTEENFRTDFLDVLGINVSDGYIKYILGINNNPEYKEFASQFETIPEDVLLTENDFTIIRQYHNDKKDIFTEEIEKEKESVVNKLRKIAKGNAYFDETVLESTYQDAEGKYIYAHQNKTFNLSLANIIKESWAEKESVKEIKDKETKRIISTFHTSTPIAKTIAKGIPFYKFGRKRLGGFRQEAKDDAGVKLEFGDKNASFKEMTPEEFETSKLNLFTSATKTLKGEKGEGIIFVPQFVGHFETANTAEFQYVEYLRPLDSEGNLTITAKEQFVEYLEVEYNRIQEFIKRLVDTNIIPTEEDGAGEIKLTTELLLNAGWNSAIAGYYTGNLNYTVSEGIVQVSGKQRALQLSTELNAFEEVFPLNEALSYNKNTGLSKMKNVYSQINSIYQKNLEKQILEMNKVVDFNALSKVFKGEATTEAEKRIQNNLGFGNNTTFNLKMYLANYELNAIGYERWIYGDMLLFNKNDMSDKFKRNKGSNAAVVSPYSELLSPSLGIDKQFRDFRILIHEEVVGKSDVDGGDIDKMDAQALASVQHTRHLLFGLGRLSKQEAKLLTKVHNGESFSKEDREWMFNNDTFLSANKTVGYSTLMFIKMSEAYSETLSKLNTSLKESATEEEFNENSVITKDGRIYPVVGAEMEVTRELQEDETYKYFKWTVAKDRKSLYEKRLSLEGWRKQDGKWKYQGRDFEYGIIMPGSASKRMSQNIISLDNEGNPDWEKLTEIHLNVMSANDYGLQVENQGIKDKITDPSQNIEIITNELGDVVVTDMLTGKQNTVSGKEFTKLFQEILAKRDRGSFDQAYKELIKNDNPIYKYLFELIKSGIDSTSSDPQLQQLVEVDVNGNYKYNLNIPLFQQKFQQYLFAYLTKGVLAQKRAGDALVMTSPHGHNLLKKLIVIKDNKGKIIDYSWRVVQRKSEEYKNNINNAEEGFIDLQYKANNIGSWKERIAQLYTEKKEEFYFIDEVRFGVPEYKDGKVIGKFSESLMGKWDVKHSDVIQESFRWMFGVRIPSQDKQSSINIKLVDWLEDGAGNAIVVPKEYQQLSGADYDVDKIYTYKSEGYWEGDKFVQYTKKENKAEDFIQWRKYYFSSNKTAKKLKENELENDVYYQDLKRSYLELVNFKKQVLNNLDLPQEESDLLESIENKKEYIEFVSKDKRRKEFKSVNLYKEQLKELEDKLQDLNSVKKYLENKKRFNEKLYDVKNELHSIEYAVESEILQELQLPSTLKEYTSNIVNSAVENNMLLSMYQSALSSEKLTTPINVKTVTQEESPYTKEGYELYIEKTKKGIYETGTSVDWLKKADKFYKSLAGITFKLENKTFGLRSAVTDFTYFKGTQGGKKGIGSAVNANLSALTWLKTNGYDLGIKLNLDGYTTPLKYTQVTLDGLERTADNISTQITATTDEAKEQALAKYNIRGKALDVFATMLGLGFRIDQAVLLVNVPLVQKYLDDRKVAIFPEKYIPETYTQENLADLIKGNKIDNETDLELSALYDFVQLEKQAEINSNLMKFIRLKRGFSPEYESFQNILDAGFKLGFGNIKGLEKVYGTNSEPLFNFASNLQENKKSILQLHQYVTNIIPQVKNVTEKFLLVANPEYKNIIKTVTKNVKVNNKTKAKIEKEVMTWMMGNSIPVNTNVIMGENTVAKEILALQETMKDNALISHLISYINKDGFDQIGIKAFSRLTVDKQESLIDGFNILLLNKDTEKLAFRIYDYFGVKDGWLYKPNSISKAFPVHMFSKMSKAVEEFLSKKYTTKDVDGIIENILTDVSNKSLLYSVKEGSILGQELTPSTFDINGNKIPIMVDVSYTNKKKEKVNRKVNVEYNVKVDENIILPNFIKDGNHLYKKYVISDTEYKYVLIPFLGEPKIKISGVADKTVYSGDVVLANSLIFGVGGKKGRWESLLSSPIGNEYKKLIADYKKYLQNTIVVENNSVLEEGEENEIQVSTVEIKEEGNVISENKLNIWWASGENKELSNLAPRDFELDGKKYYSVEHAYQTWKSGEFDKSTYDAYTKGGVKIVGKKGTKTLDNWNIRLMKRIMLESFKQNETAKQLLILTENKEFTHTQAGEKDVWFKEFPRLLKEVRNELKSNLTNEQQVELYRQQEQEELKQAIPNYNGNKESLSVAELKKYNEIYDKYDRLINPLLNEENKDIIFEREEVLQSDSGSIYKFIIKNDAIIDGTYIPYGSTNIYSIEKNNLNREYEKLSKTKFSDKSLEDRKKESIKNIKKGGMLWGKYYPNEYFAEFENYLGVKEQYFKDSLQELIKIINKNKDPLFISENKIKEEQQKIESKSDLTNLIGQTREFNVGEDENGFPYIQSVKIIQINLTDDNNYKVIAQNNVNGKIYNMITEPSGNVLSYSRNGKTYKGDINDEIAFLANDYVKKREGVSQNNENPGCTKTLK